MDLSSEPIKRTLTKYKFRDVAVEELQKVHRLHPDVKPVVDSYTCTDNLQKDLLKLIGNIPVNYQGRTYNLPIQLWLLESFPFTPPICTLRPTPNMDVREGKHVDGRGRIYLPGLHNWDHPKSTVNGLLDEMIAKFEDDPPLSAKPTAEDPNDLLAFVSNLKMNEGSNKLDQPLNKVSVVGSGDLGLASVMALLAKGSVDRLVLIDIPESSTKSGTADLEIFTLPKVEISKDLSASSGSKVIVVTANAWSNDQSYVGVVQTNVDLYRRIIPALAQFSPNAVLLVASQPVDIMTHVAWRQSGLPPTHVIGMGCNLDSERLQHIVGMALVASSAGKQPWVIGELSDNKVGVWSLIKPGTGQFPELTPVTSSTRPIIDRGFEILKSRGQRSWSVGLSVADITHSIITDLRKTHSVSTLAQGWGGIGVEVFLSLPCALGASGSTRLAGLSLDQEEEAKIRESVASLACLMKQIRM
ncbi:ubiquitin-conjugating enzyme E2 variant 3 [Denticeps clupeoides]|uniref:UEV domain-containing protein n=1 Tax=Denticeps clupeoides TaxID=299321 RepID=A0AAY4CKW7_9TELE|nr:ubiquitin-conjugating enzyme E2 variant 3-like [Denticeps clupeoides]